MPAFSSGPLGPGYAKFDFAAVYGRAWVCRANAPGAYSDGRPKGLPYPISEGFLENRRGGAEGESAEGREKPPWGVPLRKQHGRNQIRRRGDPCGRLYSRCESWRAHAMRPYWFPVDCRGGYQPPARAFPLQGGRTIPPIRGKCPEGTKGVGGHGEAVTDEGALLDRNPYSNGRAGEGTRPYGENRTVAVGSAEPGAVVEPQQRQFLQTQGPVARMEPQKVTRRRGGETPPVKQKPSSSSAERKISSPSTALQ